MNRSGLPKPCLFKVDGNCVLIVAAGDARIDNRKYKDFFHTKAKMLSPDEVEEMYGSSDRRRMSLCRQGRRSRVCWMNR